MARKSHTKSPAPGAGKNANQGLGRKPVVLSTVQVFVKNSDAAKRMHAAAVKGI